MMIEHGAPERIELTEKSLNPCCNGMMIEHV